MTLCEQCYNTPPGQECPVCGEYFEPGVELGEYLPELDELFGALDDWCRDRTVPGVVAVPEDRECPRCGLPNVQRSATVSKPRCVCNVEMVHHHSYRAKPWD